MKEIKVRCWDGEKMIYPEYLNLYKQTAHWTENSIPAMSNILMLYTGLKDKNGEEIYEADIVQYDKSFYGGDPTLKFRKCVVEYKDNEFIPHHMTNPQGYEVEIVGNVYQNPDLLK